MIVDTLDPRDINGAALKFGKGWMLHATVYGRVMPVIDISRERKAYMVEHWERFWVPAKDVTELHASLSERQWQLQPIDVVQVKSWEEFAANWKPYQGPSNDLS